MIPINGEPAGIGSQNLLKDDMGKREVEITDTILKNNSPDWMVYAREL